MENMTIASYQEKIKKIKVQIDKALDLHDEDLFRKLIFKLHFMENSMRCQLMDEVDNLLKEHNKKGKELKVRLVYR